MKISKRQLRRIIKESMNSMEQSYVSKINELLSAGTYESHVQGIELIKALSEEMPGLKDHPDLMIHSAHDIDGEVFQIKHPVYRSTLTKAEAESFKEYDGEKVYIVNTYPSEDGIGTRVEYDYSFPGWNAILGGKLRRG